MKVKYILFRTRHALEDLVDDALTWLVTKSDRDVCCECGRVYMPWYGMTATVRTVTNTPVKVTVCSYCLSNSDDE